MKKQLFYLFMLLIFFSYHSWADTESASFYYEFKGEVDATVWEKGRYSFPGSCPFNPLNVVSGQEFVSLRIAKSSGSATKAPYSGAQLMSKRFYTYGKFTIKMRAPILSGTVCSFFLMNKWQLNHWLHKEIDIEFLGKDRHSIQFNIHRYYNDTESGIGTPFIYNAPFDYGAGFHEYTIVWEKKRIEWLVNGQRVYERTEKVPDEPLAILMNAWIPDESWGKDWVGVLNDRELPCQAEYAWLKYEPLL